MINEDTFLYIVFFKFIGSELNNTKYWLFGISPEGIGVVGMAFNVAVSVFVSRYTKAPPNEVLELVDNIRMPSIRAS